ncbi:MAG: hypothetical protein ACRENU_17145 [Gemmatimonadaceae bacterium]
MSANRLLIIALATGMLSASAAAQDGRDPLMRLERTARYSVEVLLDSARLMGLPTRPIESKVLEGLSKNKPPRLILNVARNVFRALREARAVLGPTASVDELEAAAVALNAGVTQADLAQLARSRQEKAQERQLTVPLVVLVDLISRGVPRDTASQTILQLRQQGAADDDFLGLWRGVERDIVSGADPGAALLNRAREVPSRGPPPVSPPRPE